MRFSIIPTAISLHRSLLPSGSGGMVVVLVQEQSDRLPRIAEDSELKSASWYACAITVFRSIPTRRRIVVGARASLLLMSTLTGR